MKEVNTADGSVAVEFSHYFRIIILKKIPLIQGKLVKVSINETKTNWEDKFPQIIREELNLKSKKSNVPTRASEIPNFRTKKSLGGGSQADTNDHSVPIRK